MDQDHFTLAGLLAEQAGSGKTYLEFLRSAALSCGLYVLPAGAVDGQQPHTEDEVYYVVRGQATFRAGQDERPARPGDVFFVAARVPHRFHTIEEELVLLVFFAPPEGNAPPA